MDAIHKMSLYKLKALYEQLKVREERNFCPRQGIYKIINTYKGECYYKPALMAKCNWRTTVANKYHSNFEVIIQLESFKKNSSPEQLERLCGQLIGQEIDVFTASENPDTKVLELTWKFIDAKKVTVSELNSRLNSGSLSDFQMDDSQINSTPDYDLDTDY